MGNNTFSSSLKSKIIIAFLSACMALGAAYFTGKLAFSEALGNIEKLSLPNEKLQSVNNLFSEITNSGNLFKELISSGNKRSYDAFLKNSESMIKSLESLRNLCIDNNSQLEFIDSVKTLMLERKKIFEEYLSFRWEIRRNNQIGNQIKELETIILNPKDRIDSFIFTTEEKKTITTVLHVETAEQKQKRKGFWESLFKKTVKSEPRREEIVQQDIKTKIDTLVVARKDSVLEKAEELLKDISEKQNTRREVFYTHEAAIADFDKNFINKALVILTEIEKEVIQQTQISYLNTKTVVGESIQRIKLIILITFLFTVLIIFFILTDISKSNKYKAQLEVAKKEAEFHSLAKQRFLSNMSHEIRTPLQSIIGYAEQIRGKENHDKNDLNAIHSSSIHLLQIVNEILDYSRIISGKFTFEKKSFEIKSIIEEVLSIIKPGAEKKGIQLMYNENEIPEEYLLGDPFRVKQILLNLLENAVKYTEKGSVNLIVKRTTQNNNFRYEFRVEDTGNGIPKELQEKIFDQFEQIATSGEKITGGTGLGLSISKALAEGQGGEITVDSEPGKGSCFTLFLNFEKASAPVSGEWNFYERLSWKFKGEVWIIDDDKLILNLCSKILSKYHISHCCFSSAEEVLALSGKAQADIIFADIRMPGMGGIELCGRLKEKGKGLKIFALTAQALPEERSLLLKQGFDGVLMKPFREAELLAVIEGMAPYYYHDNTSTGKNKPDLTPILKMSMGDNSLVESIFENYISETLSDLEQIKKAFKGRQIEKLSLVLHRVSGRTSQIGAVKMGASFRRLEISLQNNKSIEAIKPLLDKALSELMDLIKGIEEELESRCLR